MTAQEARNIAARMRVNGLRDISGRRDVGVDNWVVLATGFAGERITISTIAAWTEYANTAYKEWTEHANAAYRASKEADRSFAEAEYYDGVSSAGAANAS